MPDDETESGPRRPPCPICAKPATREFRPFCSKRCANVDLGRWLGGRYAIPGEPVHEDEPPDSGDGEGSGTGQGH
jgi:hypothetical protein